MTFLFSCAWVFCLLASFVGYGRSLLLLCGRKKLELTLCAAIGACLFIALGGILNLLHAIRPSVIIGLVAFGILAGLVDQSPWRPRRFHLGEVLLGAALLVPILGNIRADVRTFNVYDDLPAYLTLTAETSQLHTLPGDPFNERRVTSSLGAPYFLQASLLAGNDVQRYPAVDVSIGWILYAGLMFTALERMGLPRRQRVWLTTLVLFVPVFRINLTFVVLPAALFCGLFVLLLPSATQAESDSCTGWRRALPLAVVTAGLCALKSNYLPAAILICGLFYLGELWQRKRRNSALEAILWACCVLALLAPWMIDLHAKEATFLFPVLGRGFDASAYGTVPLPNGSRHGFASTGLWVWITAVSFAGPYLMAFAAICLAWRRKQDQVTLPLSALLLGTALAIASLASSTGGESIGRYSLPFQVPAWLLFGGFLLRSRQERARALLWTASVVMFCAYAAFLAALFGIKHGQYRTYLEDARVLTPPAVSWFDPAREVSRVDRLQAAIPSGTPILARMFVTYPFDFARNRVYVADYTGMAGLPPGMPINQSPEAVRTYLTAHGIRYLAYDYRRTMLPDDDPATSLGAVLANPGRYGRHGWLYMQVKITNSEQQLFSELGNCYRRIYDDGEVFVADLSQPQITVSAAR